MARQAEAEWKGDLKGGNGRVKTGSGGYDGNYSFATRFENGAGANPEELLGAAHAGCFSMALANSLASAGFTPTSVKTKADVHLNKDDKGFLINLIELSQQFMIIEGISLSAGDENKLSLNLRIKTLFREDEARAEAKRL